MCKRKTKVRGGQQLRFEFMNDLKYMDTGPVAKLWSEPDTVFYDDTKEIKCSIEVDDTTFTDAMKKLLDKVAAGRNPSQLSFEFERGKKFTINGNHLNTMVCGPGCRASLLR